MPALSAASATRIHKLEELPLTLTKLLSSFGLAYVCYCGCLFLFQRHLIFPRRWIEAPQETPSTSEIEKLWVATSFGKVESWYLPRRANSKETPGPTVIFAHGNGELIDIWPDEFQKLAGRGFGVLLVEYPGYGRSEGQPSQGSITETLVAAYDRLVARPDVDPSKIVLFGRSLGGGAVCALAARRPSAAMVLMSAFTSLRPFARRYLAPSFLLRSPFDNLETVRRYTGPVLVVHGTKDSVVPYDHGVALHRAAKTGRLLSYESDHNDCPPDWDDFFEELERFLRESGVIETEIGVT